MSPTVFKAAGFRFYFFSREETRLHVHVHRSNGEAKFWIEPEIELAANFGLTGGQINRARKLIEDHESEIRKKWKEHFEG